MIKKVLSIIFLLAFFVVVALWITDFIRVRNEKEPMFCIKENVYNYEDGTVDECIGLGYKVYEYKRESITGVQFGSFLQKMKEEI